MKLVIQNLKQDLDEDVQALKEKAARKLRVKSSRIKGLRIIKESVDARKKPHIQIVYSIAVEVEGSLSVPATVDIRVLEEEKEEPVIPGTRKMNHRPVVIGLGPAGLFAGLVLARSGYKPLIFERGESVEKRTELVKAYWETGVLNPETNVQFGEGGAGTFSDGKLTTRIHDRRCDMVLQEFHRFGAHEEILYKARPHIGTDILKDVIANMRKEILSLGGEIRFQGKLTGIGAKNGCVDRIYINGNEEVETEALVLAIGHSARDTFQMLHGSGVPFIQKPFSIGVRIEHPQELINQAQYGAASSHPRLGAADYQLFCKVGGRTAYSFCMCPGGFVVAAASEPETIVTNGMSEFRRNQPNANSALVVSVEPGDFGASHPLAGVEFQRKWERLAFEAGGRDNSAPIQRLQDFVEGVPTRSLGSVRPSYTGKTNLTDMHLCLPSFVTEPMKASIGEFDRKIRGFGMGDALLTGVETRTSSPVRIPRNDNLEVAGFSGLYPAGEGAGYAGGIVSAAVDGIRIAEQIVKTWATCEV